MRSDPLGPARRLSHAGGVACEGPGGQLHCDASEEQPLTIQLRVVSWAQIEGQDSFQDSTDLLATPTVFTMGPTATQILRVALRSPLRSDAESAYRLDVEEVPEPIAGVAGMQVALLEPPEPRFPCLYP